MIEKKNVPKSDIGHANKKVREVENSYLLPFLSLSLKFEANTACQSYNEKNNSFFGRFAFGFSIMESPGNPLPINTLITMGSARYRPIDDRARYELKHGL